jgi:hypothetical protein
MDRMSMPLLRRESKEETGNRGSRERCRRIQSISFETAADKVTAVEEHRSTNVQRQPTYEQWYTTLTQITFLCGQNEAGRKCCRKVYYEATIDP